MAFSLTFLLLSSGNRIQGTPLFTASVKELWKNSKQKRNSWVCSPNNGVVGSMYCKKNLFFMKFCR